MHIFISHASANSRIARALSDALVAAREDVTTFVASRPGDIRANEDWLRAVERALQQADAYIVVLTPESVLRPWVSFESGAGWFFGRKLIFVRIEALSIDEIPMPIQSRQVYCLESPEQLRAIFEALELPLLNTEELVRRLVQEAAADIRAGGDEPAWEGIRMEGAFYAWSGPLLRLQDREPVPAPAGLLDEIQRRGLIPRWANQDRVPQHIQRGLAQVFATDQRTWRRPVMDRGHPLLVGSPNAEPRTA